MYESASDSSHERPKCEPDLTFVFVPVSLGCITQYCLLRHLLASDKSAALTYQWYAFVRASETMAMLYCFDLADDSLQRNCWPDKLLELL